ALPRLNWATKLGICRSETVSDSPSGSVRPARFGGRYGCRFDAFGGVLEGLTHVPCWWASEWPRGPCWHASAPDKHLLRAHCGLCESRCVTAVSRVRMKSDAASDFGLW